MIRVSLKGLAARPARAVLTALAIVLGVAMVSGSFVVTDTITKAFDTIFAGSYRNTDAVVSKRSLVDYSNSGNGTVSASLLARIRRLPEVRAAAGSIIDLNNDTTNTKLIGRDGKAIEANGNPTFGFGVDPSQPRFNPLHLVAGRWASGPHDVVIDSNTARTHDFAVGDSIGAAAKGPRQTFRITGIAKYGDVDSLGGATIGVFTIPTAQRLLKLDGYTAISVAARPGVSRAELVRRLERVVPGGVQVKTGDEQARADRKNVQTFLSVIRGFLLGFGGIALFVGAFVIFNTLSITVAQRTRELATLRTLGAYRRQVLRVVVLESLALGVLASLIGIGAGIGLARGLTALFDALGLSLPQSSPVYATRTFVIALLLGVIVTVLAGLWPAVRATRVPPIAAVREGAVLERRRRLGPIAGVALFALATALIAYATLGGNLGSGKALLALAGGTLIGLLGVAGFAPALVSLLAKVVGFPARTIGGSAGKLASSNAVRNPARTASTAAALMIGLALVSFVAVLGKGVHGSVDRAVRQQIGADWVIGSKNGWSAFTAAAGAAAERTPGITRSTSIRSDRGRVRDANATVNGVDPKTVAGLYRFDWRDGSSEASLARLGDHGALVKRSFASKHGLRLGDAFTLRTPSGKPLALKVVGVFQPPRVYELLGGVVISQHAFDRTFDRPSNQLTLIDGDVPRTALERSLAAFPDTKIETEAEYVKSQSSWISTMTNLLYVLLALSVLVSLFGMVNTLVLSVFERTRELGMLRAVGLTRRQTRRMVRHESVITALIGASLGLPLGILLAAAVTHAVGKYGVAFSFPVASIVAFTVTAIVAGILAAVAPARRASRLDVLSALQYE
ncbi:MAG TPA: FtsX-like permease family protein [Gaiellaceae bacterium]|nr:FtsX-like permease family protein [Gaiellaceae bacterium]